MDILCRGVVSMSSGFQNHTWEHKSGAYHPCNVPEVLLNETRLVALSMVKVRTLKLPIWVGNEGNIR